MATNSPNLVRMRSVPSELPGRWLVAAVLVWSLAVGGLMAREHVDLDPSNHTNQLVAVIFSVLFFLRLRINRARSRTASILRDAVDHMTLFSAISLVGALASYSVAANTSGFDDVTLERADRLLRFDWVSLYNIVAAHPLLQLAERAAYESIFISPAILLGYFAVTGRRAEARLFIASFWLAVVVTLALFAMAPAQGPLATLWHGPIPYMPESALYQAQLIPELRDHQLQRITLSTIHGLVCAPSFHAVSAMLFIFAAWPIRRLRWPLLILNLAMLLSTPIEGTHYLVDILTGMLVAIACSALVRSGVKHLVPISVNGCDEPTFPQ